MADADTHSAYRRAGVDYALLDAGKRSALQEALATSQWLTAAGGRALDQSRGEPAFVLRPQTPPPVLVADPALVENHPDDLRREQRIPFRVRMEVPEQLGARLAAEHAGEPLAQVAFGQTSERDLAESLVAQ